MNANTKRSLLALTITVIFLLLAFYRVDLAQVGWSFKHVNYVYLLLVSLVICLGFVIRALRWRYMLQSQYKISTRGAFSAMMIGYLVNNLLPARLGELARAYVLHRKEGISVSFSLATIIVERVFDTIVVVAGLFVTLPLFSASALLRRVAYLGGGMLAAILVVLVLSIYWERRIVALAVRIVGRFSTRVAERVAGTLTNFVTGMRTLQSRFLVLVFLLSILAWVASVAGLHLTLLSMDISIPFGGAILVTALLGVSMMIPASPGAVGTYEFFATSGLVLFGVERAQAVSFSLLLHLVSYVLMTGLGLCSLWSRGLGFAEIGTPGTIVTTE